MKLFETPIPYIIGNVLCIIITILGSNNKNYPAMITGIFGIVIFSLILIIAYLPNQPNLREDKKQ